MTHLAFLCAMPIELRPLARRLSLRRARVEGISAYAGTCGGRPALALATGMGTALAAAATERLLDAATVSHVRVFGIAGAIDGATPVGTIVRPELTVAGASGRQFVPRAAGDGGRVSGILWTTDELITGGDVLADLRARGVVALDMETAAIAEVCARRGVSWSVVRVISDRAGDGTVTEEVFRLNHADGSPDLAAVTRCFLRHPGHLPRMIRLAGDARLAARLAADAAINDIAGPSMTL
jgi:adenosylhomocysteine nucleosidase